VYDRCGLTGDYGTTPVAGGAERVAEADARAFRAFLESGLEGFGVDGFGGRVSDHVELAAPRGAGVRTGGVVTTATSSGEDREEQYEKGGREADLHAAPP